jgi:hypothetical protein
VLINDQSDSLCASVNTSHNRAQTGILTREELFDTSHQLVDTATRYFRATSLVEKRDKFQ